MRSRNPSLGGAAGASFREGESRGAPLPRGARRGGREPEARAVAGVRKAGRSKQKKNGEKSKHKTFFSAQSLRSPPPRGRGPPVVEPMADDDVDYGSDSGACGGCMDAQTHDAACWASAPRSLLPASAAARTHTRVHKAWYQRRGWAHGKARAWGRGGGGGCNTRTLETAHHTNAPPPPPHPPTHTGGAAAAAPRCVRQGGEA